MQGLLQESVLEPGQLVYVCNRQFTGRHKIQDVWLPVPHRVLAQLAPGEDVYSVVPINCSKPPRNLNRMELRRCGPGVQLEERDEQHNVPPPKALGQRSAESSSEEEMGMVRVRRSGQNALSRGTTLGGPSSAEELEDADGSEGEEELPLPVPVRRSTRGTAGVHSNPFNLPRSAVNPGEVGAAVVDAGHIRQACTVALKEIFAGLADGLSDCLGSSVGH